MKVLDFSGIKENIVLFGHLNSEQKENLEKALTKEVLIDLINTKEQTFQLFALNRLQKLEGGDISNVIAQHSSTKDIKVARKIIAVLGERSDDVATKKLIDIALNTKYVDLKTSSGYSDGSIKTDAIKALGNHKGDQVITALKRILNINGRDKEEELECRRIRHKAIYALKEIGTDEAISILCSHFYSEPATYHSYNQYEGWSVSPDSMNRHSILKIVSGSELSEVKEFLLSIAKDTTPIIGVSARPYGSNERDYSYWQRKVAIEALKPYKNDPKVREILTSIVANDSNDDCRNEAKKVLLS